MAIRMEMTELFSGRKQLPWEQAAFNPCTWFDKEKGMCRMVYRATPDPHRFVPGEYVSAIGYAESSDGKTFIREDEPLLTADMNDKDEAAMGKEDPTLQRIEGEFFMYYTKVGYSEKRTGEQKRGIKVRIGLSTSSDLRHWQHYGVVAPDVTSKSAVLFPRKIGGEWMMLYSPYTESPESKIMVATFKDREQLKRPPKGYMDANVHDPRNLLFAASTPRVVKGPEVGAPPVETEYGWLLVFCPEHDKKREKWPVSLALLDKDDPRKILSVMKRPLIWAQGGRFDGPICHDCIFPRGALVVGDELWIFTGMGDNGVLKFSMKLNDVWGLFG